MKVFTFLAAVTILVFSAVLLGTFIGNVIAEINKKKQ